MVDVEIVARYNRHGHLCAPIRFQEVITTLGNTDPRVAMRRAFFLGHRGGDPVVRLHSYQRIMANQWGIIWEIGPVQDSF